MKLDLLRKQAVKSAKPSQRLTTLSDQELNSVVAGIEACNCPYKYGTTTTALS